MTHGPDLAGESFAPGRAFGEAEAPKVSRHAISRGGFLKLIGASAVGGAYLASGGFLYARDLETGWVELTRLRLSLPCLPEGFAGYRVVHISDLHLDDEMAPDYLDTVVRLVNEQEPDLIAFTGDFVTFSVKPHAARLVEVLGRLRARDGTVAVLGNHDHDTDPALVRAVIREGGMTGLHNDVFSIERGGETLHVCGVDDVWMGRPDLDRLLRRLPRRADDGAAILLAHEPDFADVSARTDRFDLQLSGHSHGGQVRLPGVGALRLPRYAKKYPIGLYRVGRTLLYTNRGLGMLPPRVRFLCRPEITTLTLMPQHS